MFTFPFIAGNPETALLEPFTLVLTEKAATKFFGRTNILGETLYLPEDSAEFKITGVIENYPSNTHLKFDLITSFETLRSLHMNLNSWWAYGYYTYLELHPNTDYKVLEDKIKFISRNYIADQEDGSGYRQEYALQKFSSIHLESDLRSEMEPNSRKSYVYIFGIVGVFILVIACINFMNLATARSAKRAKEIGIRKVSGAHRSQLISQFMSESVFMTIVATLFSIILTLISLPYFNNITGKALTIEVISDPNVWITILIIIIFVGFLAGSYPSLFLSAIKPTET
jgi:putative ABC transport system permease protein